MKSIIQCRRVEGNINFPEFKKIWDEQGFSVVDYLSPDIDYFIQNRVPKDIGDIYKTFTIPQKFGVYKDRRGKIWLIHHYNYLYTGNLEDLVAKWYGIVRVQNILKGLKTTMFISTLSEYGSINGGARTHCVLQQDDRYVFGEATAEKVTSLKFIRVRDVFSPIYVVGELK